MYQRTLTEEHLNTNYLLFIQKLQKYNCYSDKLFEKYGEDIKYASFSTMEKFGGAYRGSLIDITLNVLCKIGYVMNEMVFGFDKNGRIKFPLMCVNSEKLMRVLLLMNIAKAEMFIPNPNDWRRNNGTPYDFNQDLATNMKLGQRCVYLCNTYGISLTEDETEAIYMIDNENDEGIRFRSPLAAIAMAAQSLTLVELRQRYLADNKKEEEEK